MSGNKQIANYLGRYYRSPYFNAGYVLSLGILLAVILYRHYVSAGSAYTQWLAIPPWLQRYALYCIPFVAAYLLQCIFFGWQPFLQKKRFWALVLLAPALFTLRVQMSAASFFWGNEQPELTPHYYTIQLAIKAIALLLPTALCWLYLDGKASHAYGLRRPTGLALYGIFILLMLPLLWVASLQPAFLEQYPRAWRGLTLSHYEPGQWVPFELAYAFNFLSIEFFFRGFLILAFLQICGKHAILPAACFYCCIHLDKPLAEAISSFFGGWLLGLISYNTKSIWGGWLVHVAIAWGMEVFAMLQHQ